MCLHKVELILNDLLFKRGNTEEIAEKYDVNESYVVTVKQKLRSLKYPPKVIDGKIVCYKCESFGTLIIHHVHSTGEFIAVVCTSCNIRLGDNELEYQEKKKKERKYQTINLYEETVKKLKLLYDYRDDCYSTVIERFKKEKFRCFGKLAK